ncbi:flagellar biosynthetic protein FliO [Gayadomonas joobiniege]|uniref:flagellar biosynthetic protein FliO n=1 Tax=Gayadomonas joobiniege TaxID=1234606 RepID=UPI00036E5EE3|nr:flagellar biosynthetic protein FliO [Gayadomonas joobiniege]
MNTKKSWLALFVLLSTPPAYAQSNVSESIISLILGLLTTLAVIFVLANLAKKSKLGQMKSQGMKVVSVLPLSNRERLMLVEVGDSQLLLGVTAHSIQTLKEFSPPLDIQSDDFKTTLAGFMKKNSDV